MATFIIICFVIAAIWWIIRGSLGATRCAFNRVAGDMNGASAGKSIGVVVGYFVAIIIVIVLLCLL